MNVFLLKGTCASFKRAAKLPLAFGLFILLAAVFFVSVNSAQAAPRKGYEALQVMAPKQGFTLKPGEVKKVTIGFQNTGTSTWVNSGRSYVSIYTFNPKYRISDFKADDWKDFTQAALLSEAKVAPGEVGHIILTLKAPISQGQYTETFKLAAEDTTWIPGGEFDLIINIGRKGTWNLELGTGNTEIPAPSTQHPAPKDGVASPVSSDGLSATLLLRSRKNIKVKANEEIDFKIGVKNTGTVSWTSLSVKTNDISIASTNTRHASWVSANTLANKITNTVKPGALDFVEFTFKAPSTRGEHLIRYRLAANDSIIPDFYIDIPVEVTTGSPGVLESPVVISEGQIIERLIVEPKIRIGLLTVDSETDHVVEISCNTPYKLIDEDGGLLGQIEKGQMVRAFYKNQRYYFNRGRGIEQTHKYIRFVPDSEDAVCTVENFDRRKTRNAGYADNQFRDVLELRYNSAKNRTWLINELPIDEYLYGLAETSNLSHEEFKKALITVARTYAMYHWERATKHAKEFYHMNAYADDQVYKGYGYEVRNSLIKKAVEDTAGIIVTYNGATALTPYFSRSDGRTRDWSEVWGGQVEWIKSVKTPCDARRGYTLWGHGVGLCATEALCMAKENGKDWQEILNYFFTNIQFTKRWE